MPIFVVGFSALDCSSNKRQYCGALLWDLALIWVIFTDPTHGLSGRGGPIRHCPVSRRMLKGVCGLSVEHYATPCSDGRVARLTVGCLNRLSWILLSCKIHTHSWETIRSPKKHIFKITPVKGKGKVHFVTCCEDRGEGARHIAILFL